MQAPGEKAQYEPGPPSYEGDLGEPVFHPLPPLDDPDEGTSLPSYPRALPQTFPIGPNSTAPLVGIYKIESHLRLLGAFHQLREDVAGDAESWSVFVSRAVERFEKWYKGVVCREGREAGPLTPREQPPLDVAMVWHSYCLNPAIYLEDGLTRTKPLLDVRFFPFADISTTVDPRTLRPLDPSDDQLRTFEFLANEPFIPLLNEKTTEVRCPRCETWAVAVPYVAADGTGFAQPAFRATCQSCALQFGKEALGVRRFCEHLKSWLDNGEFGIPVAGTLLDHTTGLPDFTKAIFFNKRLLRFFLLGHKGKTVSEIGDYVHWNLIEVEACCRTGMHAGATDGSHPRLRRMLNHYRHPGLFSIDLVGATRRQCSFINQMHDLGWTAPARFSGDAGPLMRAMARYHAWLDLMSLNPGLVSVPTLDIDLVWHTHMLFAISYRDDMHRVLGRIPDHDDKVEEGALGDAFDETSRAWKTRFGVPYTYCGCLEGSDVPTSMLSRMKGTLFQQRDPAPADLEVYTTGTLASTAPSDARASHGSNHNSVIVVNNAQLLKSRSDKHQIYKRRRDALQANVASGEANAYDEIRFRRLGQGGHFVPFRGSKPGPNIESAEYFPWLVDGSSLAGGNCAAGVPGGICQIGMQGVSW